MTAAPAFLETPVAVYRVQEYLGLAYLAERLGVSEPWLRARPWLTPGWGVSEHTGHLAWRLETIREWYAEATLVERQAQWDALPVAVRKARSLKWGVR